MKSPLAQRRAAYAILEKLRALIVSKDPVEMGIALSRAEEAQAALHDHNLERAKMLAKMAASKSKYHPLYEQFLQVVTKWDVAQTVEQVAVETLPSPAHTIESDCTDKVKVCAGSIPAVPPTGQDTWEEYCAHDNARGLPSPSSFHPKKRPMATEQEATRSARFFTEEEKHHIASLREAGWLWSDITTIADVATTSIYNTIEKLQRMSPTRIQRIMQVQGPRPLYSPKYPSVRYLTPEETALMTESPLALGQVSKETKISYPVLWRALHGEIRIRVDQIERVLAMYRKAQSKEEIQANEP